MIINFRIHPPTKEYIDVDYFDKWWRESPSRMNFLDYYQHPRQQADEGRGTKTVEDILADVTDAGASGAVLHAQWIVGDYRKQNDAVDRIAKEHPETFLAKFMTVDAENTDEDIADVVEREVRERGFNGVNIQPVWNWMRANDPRYYGMYATCQRLEIPVIIHSSLTFTADRPLDLSHPLYIDQVACNFPRLKIIAAHAGFPWVLDLVAVAWRHPYVYIETGAVSPKYMAKPGSGWEPLLCYGDSILADKILMGSNGSFPLKRVVAEIQDLPLKEEVKGKWLGGNAARLLGLA